MSTVKDAVYIPITPPTDIILNALIALDTIREYVAQTNIFKLSWPSEEELAVTFDNLQTEMLQMKMANYLADWILGVDAHGFNTITLNKSDARDYMVDFWKDCNDTISYKHITSVKITAVRGKNPTTVHVIIEFMIIDPCEKMYSPVIKIANLCTP